MGRAAEPIYLTDAQEHALREKAKTFAEQGRHRWADRCQAILMRADDDELPVIARKLDRPYRTVQDWCRLWRTSGLRGIEPRTSLRGRHRKLDRHERLLLSKAIERGPRRSGYRGGVWTSPMVADYVRKRWKVDYHPGHVRKLLHELGFSMQFPREKLARADHQAQERWMRTKLPAIKKKPAPEERSSSSKTKSASNKKERPDAVGRDVVSASPSTTNPANGRPSTSAPSAWKTNPDWSRGEPTPSTRGPSRPS